MNAIVPLQPLAVPLTGVRLIEASAGTGKTFTIASLYVRAVLGHGLPAPLMPPQILVVTFTEAATQELRDRIRMRLVEAARAFRGQVAEDEFLQALLTAEPASDHALLARRLELAAEWMDEAAVFTIHGWAQRMLLQHAFGSGHPFEQTLEPQDGELFAECVRDYWRCMFYPLPADALAGVLEEFDGPDALLRQLRPLVSRGEAVLQVNGQSLFAMASLDGIFADYAQWRARRDALVAQARQQWAAAASALESTLRQAMDEKRISGTVFKRETTERDLADMRAWAFGADVRPNAARFTQDKITRAANKGKRAPVHPAFDAVGALVAHDDAVPVLRHAIVAHALEWVTRRFEQHKRRRAQMGYDDLLLRLDGALAGPGSATLAATMAAQYPLAMIDEFQDTDALQYRIFRTIYAATPQAGLLLIGDPKQAIYAFRGADIHTYLGARGDAAQPAFSLDTNYRSTQGMVAAVNALFGQGQAHAQGAFAFAEGSLPFMPASARGRDDALQVDGQVPQAMQLVLLDDGDEGVPARRYRAVMASACASEIARLLAMGRQGRCFFTGGAALKPRDIAVLVRSRAEADEIRVALRARRVRNVYLSDRDSVFDSGEARDVLLWLRACAEPNVDRRMRAALATATLGLSLHALDRLNTDERHWEMRGRQFAELRELWRRQGVLAALQRLMHVFELPARLLAADGGERALTNVLHLAELLQEAASNLDGEQALIRWLGDEIDDTTPSGADDHVVRLESDADLVRVVTIHKAKGLEYPLVYLPFACTFKAAQGGPAGYRFRGDDGAVVELLSKSTAGTGDAVALAQERADRARLQEDLRLLYVAVTRARHYCWLGVAPISASSRSKKPHVHQGAFGYLLSGGMEMDAARFRALLASLARDNPDIVLRDAGDDAGAAELAPAAPMPLDVARSELAPRAPRWWIASYSALRHDEQGHALPVPDTAREDVVAEYVAVQAQEPSVVEGTLLPGFPRGAEAGTFLHDLFETMAEQGFAATLADPASLRVAVARRCQRRGWQRLIEPLSEGLPRLLSLPLDLPGGGRVSLAALAEGAYRAELEFWFAADGVQAQALDALVSAHTLHGMPRPMLQPETINGMFKGFIDLVFEHEGRWYVADYKSNWLGAELRDYGPKALAASIAHSRYDLQYAIYLLALHRQLRARLGDAYDYDTHMGGAVYLYLRGMDGHGRGVHVDRPPKMLIEAMDDMFMGQVA